MGDETLFADIQFVGELCLLIKKILLHQKDDSKFKKLHGESYLFYYHLKQIEIVDQYVIENKNLILQYLKELILFSVKIPFAISLDKTRDVTKVRERLSLN
ncbi:unnamed protein product [Paramecium octaurelia]|uniref:Uncharacterized protein n=1 Tax=Paramecium octaurelia TaxID=43137 RepID=A0A8S1U6Z3_PAROT|nr:unnamed protein product [Paramecium octaurelia]